MAFKNLGCECAGYSEIDSKAESLYQYFFGSNISNYGDLMKIDHQNLSNFDILIAGFPCQTFSIAGKRTGFEDNRGQIIYGLSKIIKEKKPKAFLLENVKGLESLQQGKVLNVILTELKTLGYKVFKEVLQSLNFGVPQSRERIYIVGIREDLYKSEFIFPSLSKNSNIKEFLIEEDEKFLLKGDAFKTFQKYLKNKYNKGEYEVEDLIKNEYLVLDTRQSDLRLYRDKVPTLRTGRQGILYVKNKEIRKLSGLEALLLQGVEHKKAKLAQDKFSQTSILAMAGNAMTVNVMEEIGKNILEYFENHG